MGQKNLNGNKKYLQFNHMKTPHNKTWWLVHRLNSTFYFCKHFNTHSL